VNARRSIAIDAVLKGDPVDFVTMRVPAASLAAIVVMVGARR